MYRHPAEIPRARLPLLDLVSIKTPCRESWDAMTGDDKVRFCARCSKNVHDLSAMTQDEAESFLALHLDDEDACVRLYRRPDGRILTSECVQGARTRHARKVAVSVAAGLCAAFAGTLALANVHVPNGRNLPKVRARIDVKRLAAANFDDAANVTIPSDQVPSDVFARDLRESRGFSMGAITVRPEGEPSLPTVREVKVKVDGDLPRDVVSRTVRMQFGRLRLCYEASLARNPGLTGGVVVRFAVDVDGTVVRPEDGGSDIPDADAVRCVVRSFSNLTFPRRTPTVPAYVSYRLHFERAP